MTEELKQLEQTLGIQLEKRRYDRRFFQTNTYTGYGGFVRELKLRDCVLSSDALLPLSDGLLELTLINCSIDSLAGLRRLKKLEKLSLDNVTIQQKEENLNPELADTEYRSQHFVLSLKDMFIEHLADYRYLVGEPRSLYLSLFQCTIANFQEINLLQGLTDLKLTAVKIEQSERDSEYPEPHDRSFTRLELSEMELENLEVLVPVSNQVTSLGIDDCTLQSLSQIHRFEKLESLSVNSQTTISDRQMPVDLGLSFRIDLWISNDAEEAYDLYQLSGIAPYVKSLGFGGYVRHKPDGLKLFTNLETLEFGSSTVTLRDFLPVAHQIKTLELDTSVLNASKSLTKFTRLEKVIVKNWREKGLRDLKKLLPLKNQLKELEISEDGLKNTEVITEFKALESLDIEVASMKTALGILTLPLLKKLELQVSEKTDKTFTFNLKKLSQLEEMSFISENRITLKGLEYAKELRKLWLGENCKVEGIHLLEKLEYLEVTLNRRLDIHRIPEMKSVKRLKINAKFRPIYSLENFPNVEKLEITWGDELAIGKLEKLKVFLPGVLDLETTTCLDQLPNLEQLDLSCSNYSTIKNLDKLPNLKILDLRENEIESLDGLENLKNLEQLNLYGNNISDIRVLNQLPRLKEVNIAWNNITEEQVALQLEKPEIAIFRYVPHVPFLIKFDYCDPADN